MGTSTYNTSSIDAPASDISDNESTKDKARIHNVFKPVIVLDEMSLPVTDEKSKTERIEDFASLMFPLIKINEYFFGESEIDSFTINSTGFVPTVSLTVTCTNELFLTKNFPKDGDIISVMIRNKSDVLEPIRNDYVITSVPMNHRNTLQKTGVKMTFFGELFIPGLHSFLKTWSFKGTTMEIMKNIAEILQLGFSTNEENTDDKQNWIFYYTMDDFIKEVTTKAWKDENSFFDVWIDIYYNLNFVNVQKQLLATEDDVDIGALLSNVDKEYLWGSDTESSKTIDTVKVFSNYIGYRNNSFYVMNWKPKNRSTAITMEYGTTTFLSFYEHLDSLYNDPESKKYWALKIDPDYDKEKLNNHIILRGRATYDPSVNKGELARANYNFADFYVKFPWLGIQYTLDNPDDDITQWTGNHHPNYMRAQVHNLVNLVELEKLEVEIIVQGTNTNVIKGDKIPLVLIKTDAAEVLISHKNSQFNAAVEFFYSGWYYVKGFTLSWTKGDSILSNFSQKFVLSRREWPPPEPVGSIPLTENNSNI